MTEQLTEGFRWGVFYNGVKVALFQNEMTAFEFARKQKRNGYEVFDYLEGTTREVNPNPDFAEIRKLFRLLRELKEFWRGAVNMDAVAHFEAAIFKINSAEGTLTVGEALQIRNHASRATYLVECSELPIALAASVWLLQFVLGQATKSDGDLLAPFELRSNCTEALTSKILTALGNPDPEKAIVALYEEQ